MTIKRFYVSIFSIAVAVFSVLPQGAARASEIEIKIDCGEHAFYSDEYEACLCEDGYVASEDGLECVPERPSAESPAEAPPADEPAEPPDVPAADAPPPATGPRGAAGRPDTSCRLRVDSAHRVSLRSSALCIHFPVGSGNVLR